MCINPNGSFAQCLSSAQCLFMPGKDLPFFLSPVHWEHCSLCSLIGMLKSPDIFVLHLKRELRWAIEGLCPGHFNFFLWFLEVVQVDWKDGKVREWIERLLTALRLVLWGTSGNNVLTVSQGPALLYCMGTWVSWVGFFFFLQMFLPFSLESCYNETKSKAAICKSRAWQNG